MTFDPIPRFPESESLKDFKRALASELSRLHDQIEILERTRDHLTTDRNNLALEVERLRVELARAEERIDEYIDERYGPRGALGDFQDDR